jgi:hypothetical protein
VGGSIRVSVNEISILNGESANAVKSRVSNLGKIEK